MRLCTISRNGGDDKFCVVSVLLGQHAVQGFMALCQHHLVHCSTTNEQQLHLDRKQTSLDKMFFKQLLRIGPYFYQHRRFQSRNLHKLTLGAKCVCPVNHFSLPTLCFSGGIYSIIHKTQRDCGNLVVVR